jgi:hypothetical protein
MGKFAEVAIIATKIQLQWKAESPREAWDQAVAAAFPEGSSSREKAGPRNVYLGLCEEGLVSGVLAGNYTRSVKDKRYAVDAVDLLRLDPVLAENAALLWERVAGDKAHNAQMDVVIGLWRAGVIESHSTTATG